MLCASTAMATTSPMCTRAIRQSRWSRHADMNICIHVYELRQEDHEFEGHGAESYDKVINDGDDADAREAAAQPVKAPATTQAVEGES